MYLGRQLTALAAVLAVGAAGLEARPAPAPGPAEQIVESLRSDALQALTGEVLAASPAIAVAAAKARAAAQRANQARPLPDPVASLTAFAAPPETRTGPQRLSVGVSQAVPWKGKRALREQAALYSVTALEAETEATRLTLVTETRRLYHELGFLERLEAITHRFRTHLLQHEEISRARYSTGVGLGQGVVKMQAEITRVDKELLELDSRRVALVAELNSLRDREPSAPLPDIELPAVAEVSVETGRWMADALGKRPELAAASARISRAETLIQLAEMGYRPDFKLGLSYTLVDRRQDGPGRLQPPADNGDDIVGIQAGISLPVRRKRLEAGVQEATELHAAAESWRRQLSSEIRSAIGDLAQRVDLGWRRFRLVEDLLIVQAEEALESAQAGYIAGTLNALDLLDAEHVLFEAQTAKARAQADYLIGLARLEGALGAPLNTTSPTGGES